MQFVRSVLASQWFLFAWGSSMLAGVAVLLNDLRSRNRELGTMMKLVWILTVLYSGLGGLAIYYYAGRRQIRRDSMWRKGFRSVAHCYSGCGAGEVLGVLVCAGLLGAGQYWTALVTFLLAYSLGLLLTIGPLLHDGETVSRAFKDALASESASIMVMEVVAVTVDLVLSRSAHIDDVMFWSSLIASLGLGLVAAYPVNVWLIRAGIKEGMHDPRMAGQH